MARLFSIAKIAVFVYLLVHLWLQVRWQEFLLVFYLFVTVRALQWDQRQLRDDCLLLLQQVREIMNEGLTEWTKRLKRSA